MTAPGQGHVDDDVDARVARVRDRFQDRFGRPAEGVWAAPGRVNLVGEHTDYNDGFVLPFALDRTTLAAVAPRTDGVATCYSDDHGTAKPVPLSAVSPEQRPPDWSAYPLGVAWALAQQGVDVPGFDLYLSSTVPDGAGVSSSAALEGCVALALADLAGAGLERKELALAGRVAENEIAGAPTGVMDQMVSMLGEDGHALLLDCRSLEVDQVPFDPSSHGLVVLVINTKVQHALADGAYGERRAACEQAARVLGVRALRDVDIGQLQAAQPVLGDPLYRRALHVVTENARVLETVQLLRSGGVTEVGAVLSASHASLRDDFEVSCDELDTVVDAATAGGALGARMIGGGFGGSAIALVPVQQLEQVTTAVHDAARARGFDTDLFAAHPAPGARRLR